MSERIHLSQATVTEVEERLVLEALRSGWVTPLGPMVDRFEREVADRVGVAHALALTSGTAALHLALLDLGATSDTYVVVSSMTFAATANAVAYTGAQPVFVDAREDDANVDAELMLTAVRTLLHEGKEVVAALPVDLFGRCCDYDTLEPGLSDLGIPLLEDAAEALGASRGPRRAGGFGTAAVLSFNGNKIMTTSGGGMLLSNDEALVARSRSRSTQARQPVPWYEHTEVGYNYRLSNVLAAIGVGQLSRLDEMIARRRAIRALYLEGLGGVDGIRFLAAGDDGGDNCWLTSIVLDPRLGSADHVVELLNREGIEARHLWKPMHLQPVFASARHFTNGTSERLFATGVNLPSGAGLSDADVERVVTSVRAALGVPA